MDENEYNHFDEVLQIYLDFKEAVLKNRFSLKCKLFDILNNEKEKLTKNLQADTLIYRARIMPEIRWYDNARILTEFERKKIVEPNFLGFGKKDSFVNLRYFDVKANRANPSFIPYFYASKSKYTAILEVRPHIREKISVATIRLTKTLKMFNLRKCSLIKRKTINDDLLHFIARDFSAPIKEDELHYLYCQIIAENIKNLGFDGMIFSSSLNFLATNYVVFNYMDHDSYDFENDDNINYYCEPIASEVYQVSAYNPKIKNKKTLNDETIENNIDTEDLDAIMDGESG